jgi:hypothetical protein
VQIKWNKHCFHTLLAVQEHWAVLAELEFATWPAEPARAAALALIEVTFYVFAGAEVLTTATVAAHHWHFRHVI